MSLGVASEISKDSSFLVNSLFLEFVLRCEFLAVPAAMSATC